MTLPEPNLQAAINQEVTGEGSEAMFARRLERNFNDLDKRITALSTLPKASVYNDADITLSGNTLLTFNSERYDEGGLHSTSSDTGRLTAPVDGYYSAWALAAVNAGGDGYAYIALRQDGSTYLAYSQVTGQVVATADTYLHVAKDVYLTAGQYLTVYAGATSNGTVVAAGNYSPEFGMRLLP